jgi:hypothetical protein
MILPAAVIGTAIAGLAPCSCPALFDMAIARVEETYIGYRLEVDSAARPAYEARKAAAHRRAAAPGADCLAVLRQWVDGFQDGHLFILYSPSFTPAELDSLARTAVHTDWTTARLREALRDPARLDRIEGFWYAKDDAYRVGIVRDPEDPSSFLAVVVSSTVEGWKEGELKARFRKAPDGRYTAVYRMADQSTRRLPVWLSRGALLEMPGGVAWGKESPIPGWQRGMLDPEDPLAPTLRRTTDGTLVVSVPSHDGRYRSVLDSLVARNRARLLAARLLVVDLRGDVGGGSMTTAPLMPFIYARPERRPPGPRGTAVVLASPENLAYFSRWKGEGDGPPWLRDLLARMGRNLGEIVDFQVRPDTVEAWAPDTIYDRPDRVAILTDHRVASAGEAFLLFALHSPRVTTFGERTWGMIDYQSVSVIPVGCPGSGLYLGYPTIAASRRLPVGGLNRTGIAPDVPLDLEHGDPIEKILAYYRTRSSGQPSPIPDADSAASGPGSSAPIRSQSRAQASSPSSSRRTRKNSLGAWKSSSAVEKEKNRVRSPMCRSNSSEIGTVLPTRTSRGSTP